MAKAQGVKHGQKEREKGGEEDLEKKGKEESLLDYAPSSITIDEYVESRAREVMFMVKKYKTTTSNKTARQHLPRHMRRRAASHNVKRLPRRVRQQALADMSGSGPPVKTKRPSRKHRRKPSNLMTEYVRRQKRCVWLETHLWHAKRFHMTEKWGYKIPLHPNDKSARASYRANNNFCIMQDISYWCCIELKGPQHVIVSALNRMTSKEVGPSVEAAASLSGMREGKVILYELDAYPNCAIGPARFLWRVERQNEEAMTSQQLREHPEKERRMWLWVHPSCHDNILLQLCKAMDFPEDCRITPDVATVGSNGDVSVENVPIANVPKQAKQNATEVVDPSGKTLKRKAEGVAKTESKSKRLKTEHCIDPRTVPLPFVAQFKHDNKEIISLKDNLVRFRLSGPLSNTVLTDLLIPAKTEPQSDSKTEKWWSEYFHPEAAHSIHKEQTDIWQQISKTQSPGELQSNCVLALTVRDPRLLLPRVRTKVAQNIDAVAEEVLDICKKWPTNASSSPLWDETIRTQVKTTKLPDAKMNEMRSKQLVPGTALELGDEESRIPILLIQTPGCQPTKNIVRESAETGSRRSPGWGSGWDVVLPSGWAMPFWVGLVYRGARTGGLREEQQLAQEMSIPCFPLDYPDTAAGTKSEKSTRTELEAKYNRMPPAKRPNYIKLGTVAPFHCPWSKLLNDWNDSKDSEAELKFCVLRNQKLLHYLHRMCLPQQAENSRDEVSNIGMPANALVPVQVTDLSRGIPQDYSMICLPSSEDLAKLLKDSSFGGPLEQLHKDETKSKNESKSKCKDKKSPLERPIETVRGPCDREVIGYMNHGGFGLSSGKGAGVGFVTAKGLCSLLNKTLPSKQTIILVRAPHSLQYRFAYLSVNLNQ